MNRCIFALLVLAAGPAAAQSPTVTATYPPGVQAGASITGAITGTNLKDPAAIAVAGTGVKIERLEGGDDKTLPVKITADKDAVPGVRELRVISGEGASNAARIWVGLWPDTVEKEPNDTLEAAQVVEKTPATLNGRLEKATDADSYRIKAGAGETWVFRLNAAEMHSDVDGHLVLRDLQGRQLAYAMETFGRDPVLVHRFAAAGEYVLTVRDSLYRGGPQYVYRLTAGVNPHVQKYYPIGAVAGTRVEVSLSGVNLGGTERVEVHVPEKWADPLYRFVPMTSAGPANPIDLVISELPEIAEWEPNDSAANSNHYDAFPIAFTGFMDHPGDRDLIAFKARDKQVVRIQVQARRVDSRMDAVLRVLDASGKELARNDDAAGRDPELSFTAPKEGVYHAEVTSLSRRHGPGYHYRLVVSEPPQPDFALRIEPDNPVLRAGASLPVTVTVERAGYTGPVELSFPDLPEGVSVTPQVIPQGAGSLVFSLDSAPAATGWKPLKIVGTARVGDRELVRRAEGIERIQPPLTTDAAQRVIRLTDLPIVAVAPRAPFAVELLQPGNQVKQGAKLEWKVKISRDQGFDDEITLEVGGLPANVKVDAVKVAKDKPEAILTIQAADNAAVGPAVLYLQATGKGIRIYSRTVPLTIEKK